MCGAGAKAPGASGHCDTWTQQGGSWGVWFSKEKCLVDFGFGYSPAPPLAATETGIQGPARWVMGQAAGLNNGRGSERRSGGTAQPRPASLFSVDRSQGLRVGSEGHPKHLAGEGLEPGVT
ncbi:unnamed protein product [Natator depressus]